MSFKRVLRRDGYSTVVELGNDGVLRSHRVQGTRAAILDRNNELRKNRGAVRDLSFGRLALDVPLSDIPVIDRFFPGFASPSHPDHKWQVRRFLQSEASRPYRVEDYRRRVPK